MLAEITIIIVALGGCGYLLFRSFRSSKNDHRPTHLAQPKTPSMPSLVSSPAIGAPQMGECFARGLRDRLTLIYTDRDGEVTTRDVTVQEVWGKRGDARGYAWVNWLVGYCHLRQELRHFAVKSIRQASETGSLFVFEDKAVEPFLASRYGVPPSARGFDPTLDAVIFRSVSGRPAIIDHRSEHGLIDTYEINPELVEIRPGRKILRVTGNARRARTEARRAWSGRRVLEHSPPATQIIQLRDASGNVVADPLVWAASLPPGAERLDLR